MWDEETFLKKLEELRSDSRIQKMGSFFQHGNTTTLEHVTKVARLSYKLNHKWGTKVDEKELLLAAFLHDYFLYDWHTFGDKLHGYHHPYIAAEKAAADFDISENVQAMIRTHMWPLNFRDIPRSRGAWILTLSDKLISTHETIYDRFKKREVVEAAE
jgi:uncharacterized protein